MPSVNEFYSSFGPGVYYFDANGNRLPNPVTVLNPFISAPDDIPEDVDNGMFFPFDGTSAAAPNAAAVAALLISKFPSLTQAQIESAFKATATPIDGQAQSTWEPQAGYGLVNALAAYNDLSIVLNLPEMGVSGGGQAISYGEVSPSSLNDTDFGSTVENTGTVTETYTVTNVGHGTLDLTAPTITPTSVLTGFTVLVPLSSTVLSPGQSATFEIEFAPTAVGTATATVSIGSNDELNPTPFIFEISAIATAPVPEMEVEGNSHIIPYNSTIPSPVNDTYFGSTFSNGGTLTETFTIVNESPTLPLTVTSVSVSPISVITGFGVTAGSGSATIRRWNVGDVHHLVCSQRRRRPGFGHGQHYFRRSDACGSVLVRSRARRWWPRSRRCRSKGRATNVIVAGRLPSPEMGRISARFWTMARRPVKSSRWSATAGIFR